MGNNPIWFNDPLGDTIRVIGGENTEAFKAWRNSKAGEKFYKRFDTGGSRGNVNVEIDIRNSRVRTADGTELSNPGITSSLVKIDGIERHIVTSKDYNDLKRGGKDMTLYVKSKDVDNKQVYYRIQVLNDPTVDAKDIGATLLHETQHVRINDYAGLQHGDVRYYSPGQAHGMMLNNFKKPGYGVLKTQPELAKPNWIYDFNSEMWQYFNQYRENGETDWDIDMKVKEKIFH